MREVTTGYLSDLGYDVVEAGSGGAAVERFRDTVDVAAVLLDFAMPGMNGNEVARALRKIRSGVPIIFVTGYADADALSEADQGSIVPKPFTRTDLTQALDRVLGRSGSYERRGRRGGEGVAALVLPVFACSHVDPKRQR